MKDLEEVISLHREALSIQPKGHPELSATLGYLGDSLRSRYDRLEASKDLEEAVSSYQEALSLRPPGHPGRSKSLNDLATALKARSISGLSLNKLQDTQDTQKLILEATEDSFSSLSHRFKMAASWARDSSLDVSFRLKLHDRSLLLLQQLVIANPDISKQQSNILALPLVRDLACNAATDGIIAGNLEHAVSMLDQGRSLLFGALQRYRTPLDDLRGADSKLAEQLQSVGAQLEQLSIVCGSQTLPHRDLRLNEQQRLLEEWRGLLIQIRSLPGFDDFLTVASFEKLQLAAKDGPIIFLTASERRCDAFIVLYTGPPHLVPLPNCSQAALKAHYHDLVASRRHRKERSVLPKTLTWLWINVISPIVKRLSSLGIKRRSRIWWCPCSSFSLLPIHAAGLYKGAPRSDLPSLYISSYTPNNVRPSQGQGLPIKSSDGVQKTSPPVRWSYWRRSQECGGRIVVA